MPDTLINKLQNAYHLSKIQKQIIKTPYTKKLLQNNHIHLIYLPDFLKNIPWEIFDSFNKLPNNIKFDSDYIKAIQQLVLNMKLLILNHAPYCILYNNSLFPLIKDAFFKSLFSEAQFQYTQPYMTSATKEKLVKTIKYGKMWDLDCLLNDRASLCNLMEFYQSIAKINLPKDPHTDLVNDLYDYNDAHINTYRLKKTNFYPDSYFSHVEFNSNMAKLFSHAYNFSSSDSRSATSAFIKYVLGGIGIEANDLDLGMYKLDKPVKFKSNTCKLVYDLEFDKINRSFNQLLKADLIICINHEYFFFEPNSRLLFEIGHIKL